MEVYTIISHAGHGFSLSVLIPDSLQNCPEMKIIKSDDSDYQRWIIDSFQGSTQIRNAGNAMYMLSGNEEVCECNVCENENAKACIYFEKIDEGIYRIQLGLHEELYLTALCNKEGAKVTWGKKDEEAESQKWKIIPEERSYIMANSWLKLYTSKTSTGGRSVYMPTVPSFTGSDGFTYKFTDKNYWFSQENPYGDNINGQARTQIKAVTGRDPVVRKGTHGELTDGKGNYWIAVGPNVVNPNHASDQKPLPAEMYGLGKLDVVVKDSSGNKYYIPAVVGDTKLHTWNNGIIQTWKAYPDGKFTSARSNFNGQVCAEFIGNVSTSGLYSYTIYKIIFYAD